MLNSRQRAQLRGMANSLDPIFQIGKGGLNDQQQKQVHEALEARELIKLRVLESCPLSAREAADAIAEVVGADVVQVIGTKFILFRPSVSIPVILSYLLFSVHRINDVLIIIEIHELIQQVPFLLCGQCTGYTAF